MYAHEFVTAIYQCKMSSEHWVCLF